MFGISDMSKHRNRGPRNLIGPAVRRFRCERKLSQPKLATQLQLKGWDASRGVIAAIEGQVRWVADFEAVLLAKVLRVTVQELFPRQQLEKQAAEFASRLKWASESDS